MAPSIQHIIIVTTVMGICSSIGQDYYFDNEDPLDDNKTNYKPHFDETSDKEKMSQSNKSIEASIYDLNKDYNKHDISDLFNKRRVMTGSLPKKHVNNKTDTSSATKILHNNKLPARMSNKSSYSTPLNIFQAYEYIYDEVAPSYQRQRLDESGSENITDIDVSDDERVTQYDNNSIKYLADFFNIAPAVNRLDIQNHIKKYNESPVVWYVPEKYPCWQLPILFGRLGTRTASEDVFRIYSGKLIGVIDLGTNEETIPSRTYVPDVSKKINKWCSVAPCFGDHSLCVFTDNELSKICEINYKVKTPTVLEKISIVNTINSMRNSVANGATDLYAHLPSAADMKQIIYDTDLEKMAKVWLQQCLPGIDPCSSMNNNYVTQLECTKSAENCCHKLYGTEDEFNCIPMYECFIQPVVGCIHAWYASAGSKLTETDLQCGHGNSETFNTVQLIWAKTNKIGCAYGERPNGDVRVVCNFSPGAPFCIASKYFCGLISHKDITDDFVVNKDIDDVTDLKFLASLGVILNEVQNVNQYEHVNEKTKFRNKLGKALRMSNLGSLNEIYKPGRARNVLGDYSNGTMGMIARLVTRHTFIEEGQSRCDLDEPIFTIGPPGSLCLQKGEKYGSLCYDFADPTPGYRLAAILAPIVLFSLILYDLFSGVMRQTIY